MLLLLSFLSFVNAHSQDTTYYDKNSMPVDSRAKASSYSVRTRDAEDSTKAVLRLYTMSGQITGEIPVGYPLNQQLDGRTREWYETGQLKLDYTLVDDELDGAVRSFYKDGKPNRRQTYSKGKLVEGFCYSQDGNKRAHNDFIIPAEYPGGINAAIIFISQNVKYPRAAVKKNVEGTVYVQFTIDKYGGVSHPRILQGVSKELDKEALRVVKMMPKWSPYIIEGEQMDCRKVLPISFVLQ